MCSVLLCVRVFALAAVFIFVTVIVVGSSSSWVCAVAWFAVAVLNSKTHTKMHIKKAATHAAALKIENLW